MSVGLPQGLARQVKAAGSMALAPSAQCGASARQTWHLPPRHPELRAPPRQISGSTRRHLETEVRMPGGAEAPYGLTFPIGTSSHSLLATQRLPPK